MYSTEMSCWNCGLSGQDFLGCQDMESSKHNKAPRSANIVCSQECLKNLMMNPSVLEMKESKILCEHDKSMAKFLEFPVYSNLPPAIASDVSWAQTIFSTECVGEYFKSDEYQKFIEKN